MRNLVWVILLVAAARAQYKYKFCAPLDTVSESACYSLQRGDSEVSCLQVQDNAECAIRLAEGQADFGVFNAEELLLTHQFYSSHIQPILQLRHKDRQEEEFEFQTVAVVPVDLTQQNILPGERLKNLKDSGFCHPGFSQSQWWNDYILKNFENSVNPLQCQDDVTAIENEIINLKNFFGKACRPGEWAADSAVDQELKKKYPELCALCDNEVTCSYDNMDHHGHIGALQCLARGKGKVAYAALNYVQNYLKRNESYQFLCPSGTVLPLSTENPCAWLKQPWSVVVARNDIAESLKSKLLTWLKPPHTELWLITLDSIIQDDSWASEITEKMSIATYLSKGRIVDIDNIQTCGKHIRWCTISDLETNKCKWVAKAAKALGVAPSISCMKSNSTFQCFRDIQENRTDIMVIDSNYGYLARTVYDMSTVLYSETDNDKNSVTLAVVREPRGDDYPIKSFHDLKDKTACFPEYGGLTWLSFINTARTNDIISSKSCDYPSLVSDLLSGACTPGIEDSDHSSTAVPSDIASKLCSACRHQNNTSCAGNETNHYYGDRGAMRCLIEGAGDIAFVEKANILYVDYFAIDSNMYRVLCKNGSLAQNPGFTVDEFCALSVTIDSEIVGRRKDSVQISRTDTILALLKMEDWLGYRVKARRPIHMFGPFNDTRDLLFKDSSSGLVSSSSMKKTVLAYKELFSHVEECSNDSFAVTANFIFVGLVALYHLLSSHVR
ncbi:transferrin-like [Temnothorax longispinosus]|uniref:transferrin-like n=1 Tax=Temnothorax longispinosus TaxID=300112 RepID=UPI003A99C3E1